METTANSLVDASESEDETVLFGDSHKDVPSGSCFIATGC